ncbi:9036_t:CDS:2, partial [Entrophospora sp. SA101]
MVPTIINVTNKLNNVLNDVIGFQYEFNSLSSENELATAYEALFNVKLTFKNFMLMVISNKLKWFRSLPFEENIKMTKSVKVIERISLQLIRERQKQAQLKKLEGKDLLSLLININQDLPPEEKIFFIYKSLIGPFYLSPLCKIPGPPSENWKKKYGRIIVYHGFLNKPYLLLTDPKSYPQIFTSYEFTKSKDLSTDLKLILGDGILFAEGDQHKRQRKMMNPAFSKMVPSIINVANKLNNVLNDLIGDQDEKQITNINSYTSKVTLDVIGLVGFQYEFNSLNSENELAAAYEQIFDTKLTLKNFLLVVISDKFKWIRSLPFEANLRLINSVKVAEKFSLELIEERQKQAQLKKLEGKDLLSLLININQDLPPEEK